MRKAFVVVAVFVACTIAEHALVACGDKFFIVGGGSNFNRAYASLHPGSIVLYAAGNSDISKALRDARMQRHINNAGHQVRLVTDRRELDQLIASGTVDVILTDMPQAIDLQSGFASATSSPTLLPIETKASADPQHRFALTMKSSDNVKVMLDKLEKLMKARQSGAKRN
jgi:hypothetical protein